MHVSVIGAGGLVGSCTAFALQCGKIVRDLTLVDVNAEMAEGQALDLLHGSCLMADQRIRSADTSGVASSDVIVITAGLRRKPDESRLDLINRNVELFRKILAEIKRVGTIAERDRVRRFQSGGRPDISGDQGTRFAATASDRIGDGSRYDSTAEFACGPAGCSADAGFPRFSGDEQRIVYQSGDNLYSWDISTGAIRQLTNFQRGAKREEPRKSSQEQWLETDQLALFEVLQERKAETETRERRTKALAPKRPFEFYYGDRVLSNLQISPDLRFVTFPLSTRAKTRTAQMPDYVTQSGFSSMEDTRTKVGAAQDTYETGIFDTQRDTIYWVSTSKT